MLQLRPTFSESWYRVVSLKPKLRGTAQISRQYYRGDRWYVVRDPAGNQFHRLSDAAYRFIGLLDGRRTVGEAWDLVGGHLADDAPTQPEVIQILSQLYAANLVETDIPPDATVLLRRHKQLQKRQMQGRMMNILFPRIPLWDCDNFVKRWMPLIKPFVSWFGAILWVAVVIAGVAVIIPKSAEFKEAINTSLQIGTNPEKAFYLWLVFVLIKFIHELGHAFSCRRFGGEVHEMGIMFLVFVPTPYVDASTAWSFQNKWHRMFVGAGGMIIEVFISAIMAIIWANTRPGVPVLGLPLNELACYTVLIAGFTTIVFNANPLLRYDGYYILSDFLEIPNLQMKSREYVLGLIKRHVFRIKSQQPLPPTGQRVWLFFYGLASTAYRTFVGIAIILMVTWQLPIIGVLMAIGGVITWLVVPVVKLFKYLTIDPELHRKRGRAWVFSIAVAGLVFVAFGLIRFPLRVRAPAIVEPKEIATLYVKSSGFVTKVVARDGERLKKDDVILVCNDDELRTEIFKIKKQIESTEIQRQQALADGESVNADIQGKYLATYRGQLAEKLKTWDELTVRAPIEGYLVFPELDQTVGRYLSLGQELCVVQETDQLLIKGTLEQADAQLAMNKPDSLAEIRLAGAMEDKQLEAHQIVVFNEASKEMPHPAIGPGGGGEVAADPKDQTGMKSQVPQFEVRVEVDNPGRYYPGQRAFLRLTLDKEPLGFQWYRSFLQLIQARSASSKWL